MIKYLTSIGDLLWRKKNIKHSKKMNPIRAFRIRAFIISYIFITYTSCPYFARPVNDFIEWNDGAIYYIFVFTFIFNLAFTRWVPYKEYLVDLDWKLISLYLLNIRTSLSVIWFRFLKIIFFITSNENTIFLLKFLTLKFKNNFIIWRPLFKRLSYFGNYKSSRSKFIEK